MGVNIGSLKVWVVNGVIRNKKSSEWLVSEPLQICNRLVLTVTAIKIQCNFCASFFEIIGHSLN